jgi:hypothetical protein
MDEEAPAVPAGQATLVEALKRHSATAGHLTPDIERALMDADPAVRVRAGLPLCEAILQGAGLDATEREFFKGLIEEMRRAIRQGSH